MNNKTLLRALSFVDEKFIEEAAEGTAAESKEAARADEASAGASERTVVKPDTGRRKKMIRIGSAAAAVLALALGLTHLTPAFNMKSSTAPGTPMAAPQATEMAEEGREAANSAINEMKAAEAEAVPAEVPSPEPAQDKLDTSAQGPVYTAMSEYPQEPKYPEEPSEAAYREGFDWEKYNKERNEQIEAWRKYSDDKAKLTAGAAEGLEAYTEKTMKVFLRSEKGENVLYSPVNVYMALSMLAETTDGNSRQQILDVLGLPDIESLREKAAKISLASYSDDGLTTSLPGASIWLDDELDYKTDVLDRLAEHYFAFSCVGDLQSAEVQGIFKNWLSEQTKGLLDDHIGELSFSEQLRAIIASTLYYKAAWAESFNEGATREDLFHAEDGDEKAMFMNRTDYMPLYQGEGFRALSVGLAGGDSMRLVLPDEGVGIDEIVASDALYDYLTRLPDEEGAKSARIHLSLPRFDADSSQDLIAGLKELGVSEVFTDSADFSPLSDQPLAVDEISHAVRVKTDEEGIEAAAYTVIMVKATAAMPVDLPVDFIVDRPFLFEIVNAEGLPLFTGVVKHAE